MPGGYVIAGTQTGDSWNACVSQDVANFFGQDVGFSRIGSCSNENYPVRVRALSDQLESAGVRIPTPSQGGSTGASGNSLPEKVDQAVTDAVNYVTGNGKTGVAPVPQYNVSSTGEQTGPIVESSWFSRNWPVLVVGGFGVIGATALITYFARKAGK